MDTLEVIRRRRSTARLVDPAPSKDELLQLLDAAARAPDHQELKPWRFIVLTGEAKVAFGELLAKCFARTYPDATAGQLDKERSKLGRAPLVVVVACVSVETSLPQTELLAATAAATQNLLLAATALGYGSMWRTGAAAYDPSVKAELGLKPHDAITGFVYLGSISTQVSRETANRVAGLSGPKAIDLGPLVQFWAPRSIETET